MNDHSERFETVIVDGSKMDVAVAYHVAHIGSSFTVLNAYEPMGDTARLHRPAPKDGERHQQRVDGFTAPARVLLWRSIAGSSVSGPDSSPALSVRVVGPFSRSWRRGTQ
jgi:hypothetical protein